MTYRYIPHILAAALLLALAAPAPFGIVASANAKQDDPGAAGGHKKSDHPGPGGGNKKSDHAGKGQGAKPPAAAGGPAPRTSTTGRSDWQRDWAVDDFLAAGFTAAALHSLLGDNVNALHTGARPLPPGIAKNLARGKPLPPGIAMKQPAGQLAHALPRIDGHEWREVGTDLVLVTAGTLIVRELLRDVLR